MVLARPDESKTSLDQEMTFFSNERRTGDMVGSRDDFFPTRGKREQITPWTNRRTRGVKAFYGWAGNASSSHLSDGKVMRRVHTFQMGRQCVEFTLFR